MRLFSQEQVRALCVDVGWAPDPARVASAIAMCESPIVDAGVAYSDFDAVGDQDLANSTWGYSYGGFQVRSLRADKGTGRTRDEDELLRPRFNARSALKIKRSQGFGAWSTYTSGMFKAYLQSVYIPEPGTYVVLYGDTLSGIAGKLAGVTWQDLARINNLPSPYDIYIGQVLRLHDSDGA